MNSHKRNQNIEFCIILTVVLVLGFLASNVFRWCCDDIFITLRYAEQFLAGNGFVYNVGERVEGYSNFLWLVIITFLQRLGLDPVNVSTGLGIGSFLGTLAIFSLISRKLSSGRFLLSIPLTSLALIANYECLVWASSGLETAFYTLLLSLAFFVFFFTSAGYRFRLLMSAVFLVLAVMTRPDGLLIYALAGMLLVASTIRKKPPFLRAFTDIGLFAVPLIVIYLPYVLWKVSYYGSFFPNTYYAKSANIPYYSQGFYYLWLYLRAHPTSIIFLLAVPVLLLICTRGKPNENGSSIDNVISKSGRNAVATAVVIVTAYLVFFIARIGGGFMYARFIVPVLPFMYFQTEWSLRWLFRSRAVVLVSISLLLPMFVAFGETGLRNRLLIKKEAGWIGDLHFHRGIMDEYYYYTKGHIIENDRRVGEQLRPYFQGLDVTVLLRGQACFGYYAGFKTCLEGSGLTDSEIARLPLKKRGRIGHEKEPSRKMMAEKGVNFIFLRTPYNNRHYRMVDFNLPETNISAEMIVYDIELMRQLSERMGNSIRFMQFEMVLDHYLEYGIPRRSPEELKNDYEEFKKFYFDHNSDPERERILLDALSTAEGGDSP